MSFSRDALSGRAASGCRLVDPDNTTLEIHVNADGVEA